jgi:hypothetical protein
MVAVLTSTLVLSLEPKPIMMEACCELPGVWDGVRGFCDDDGTEGHSGRNW